MREVLCLAGGIASGKTTLAKVLADRCLRTERHSFGDVVRREAARRGLSLERASLQSVGLDLVSRGWPAFVDLLLEDVSEGLDVLVVDGVRHVEPVEELSRRFPAARTTLVFLKADGNAIARRLNERGESATALNHPVESWIKKVEGAAHLMVDSTLEVESAVSQLTQNLCLESRLEQAPSPGADLARVMADLREFASGRGWQPYHGPKNLVMALTGEVGELAEIFQWLTPAQANKIMRRDAADSVREEIADILIYMLYLCDRLRLNPIALVQDKMALNESRFPTHLRKSSGRTGSLGH